MEVEVTAEEWEPAAIPAQHCLPAKKSTDDDADTGSIVTSRSKRDDREMFACLRIQLAIATSSRISCRRT